MIMAVGSFAFVTIIPLCGIIIDLIKMRKIKQ